MSLHGEELRAAAVSVFGPREVPRVSFLHNVRFTGRDRFCKLSCESSLDLGN